VVVEGGEVSGGPRSLGLVWCRGEKAQGRRWRLVLEIERYPDHTLVVFVGVDRVCRWVAVFCCNDSERWALPGTRGFVVLWNLRVGRQAETR